MGWSYGYDRKGGVMVFQTDVKELLKTAISMFISGYYPENSSSKEEMSEAWSIFLEDFEDDNCYGLYGYKKEDDPSHGYFNDALITNRNKDKAVKHSIEILKKLVTESVLSEIANYLRIVGVDTTYAKEELDSDFSISSDGVTLNFNYDSEANIPMMYIERDAVSMLHITVSDKHMCSQFMEESFKDCIRYNLLELSKGKALKNKYSLYNIHLVVDIEKEHISVEFSFEKSTDKDRKVKDMTEKEISERLVSKFMPNIHTMIF